MPARGAVAARAEEPPQRMQPALGGDPAPLPQDAFRKLLQGRAVYEFEPASRTLAPYRRDAASLPETGAGRRLFSHLSDARWQFTEGEGRRALQSADDGQRIMRDSPIAPHLDPGLGCSRRRYSDFIVGLRQRGPLRMGHSCIEKAGCSLHGIRREKMRRILDSRRGYQCF